jgi:PKD repeat protein
VGERDFFGGSVLLSGSRGISGNARFMALNALTLLVALAVVASLLVTAPVVRAAPPGVVASFTYSPTLPLPNQTVVFTSTSTATGSNNQIATQAWDLDGDRMFDDATGPTAVRAFPAAGSFLVSLLVTDTRGDLPASVTQSVTVNAPPSASFAYSSSPTAGSPVYFFSTASDPDGFITSQAWDLDNDGQFDDGTNTFASRSFDSPGRYTVRLRVVDNRGVAQAGSADIIVGALSTPAVVAPAGSLTTGLRLLSPFPVVRISGVVTRAGIRLRLLAVDAPAGAKVKIRCRTRGCPFRRRSRLIESRATVTEWARVSRLIRFNRFKGRLLRPGTVVQVFVTKPGTIGKYTRLRVRSRRLPARADRCLVPGAARPVPCPPS